MTKTMSEALSVNKPTADIYEKLAGLQSAGEVKRMLDGNGLMVVPREPTDGMLIAGDDSMPLAHDRATGGEWADDLTNAYKAMITASQGGDENAQTVDLSKFFGCKELKAPTYHASTKTLGILKVELFQLNLLVPIETDEEVPFKEVECRGSDGKFLSKFVFD